MHPENEDFLRTNTHTTLTIDIILKWIHLENEEFLRTNAILTIDIILKGIHSENEFLKQIQNQALI